MGMTEFIILFIILLCIAAQYEVRLALKESSDKKYRNKLIKTILEERDTKSAIDLQEKDIKAYYDSLTNEVPGVEKLQERKIYSDETPGGSHDNVIDETNEKYEAVMAKREKEKN